MSLSVEQITELLDGTIVTGKEYAQRKIDAGFASDLMSDVLTLKSEKEILLVTGLANMQTIRTCEMSEIRTILFARGKKVTEDMIELAEENEMVLIETNYSMFRSVGLLFNQMLNPVY